MRCALRFPHSKSAVGSGLEIRAAMTRRLADYRIPALNEKYHKLTPSLTHKIKNKTFHLKLDNLQASGSFKDRGLGELVFHSIRSHHDSGGSRISQLVSSSGGNAGMAATLIGAKMGIPVQVIVPETTKLLMVERLRRAGAKVTIKGENWNAADAMARDIVNGDALGTSLYVPPFDHPLIWQGNSSIVDELADAHAHANLSAPDAIVLSVGGGGLLAGVKLGIERNGWTNKTRVLAVETEGSASFAAAKAAGRPVKLQKIDTIATSLGALAVTPATLDMAPAVRVDSIVVSDRSAVEACLRFADEFRFIVEPACGAALSLMYSPNLDKNKEDLLAGCDSVVIVVCGGSVVSLDMLNTWKAQLIV